MARLKAKAIKLVNVFHPVPLGPFSPICPGGPLRPGNPLGPA